MNKCMAADKPCTCQPTAGNVCAEVIALRKDSERLAWQLQEECVPEGFVHVPNDRYEYAMQVAAEAGRGEPTDEDCLDGLRRLVDAAMAAHGAVGAA